LLHVLLLPLIVLTRLNVVGATGTTTSKSSASASATIISSGRVGLRVLVLG
jgi:hypothetical protein